VRRLAIPIAVSIAVGCGHESGQRTYQLTGQILVVKHDTNEVLVKHEDIPGFMPAMTMPYTVKDPAELKDRTPGDLIRAALIVDKGGVPFLQHITKTGSAPLPDDARTTIPVAAGVQFLQAGDVVPDTYLLDQDGTPISLRSFGDAALAVSFIYTRCPLPQFCPLIDRRFGEVQSLVAADPQLKGKVKLLSISFDPQFDRAAVLRAHAKKVGADPDVWRFATGEEAVVDRLAAAFGVNVIREKDGSITHNLRTAVIDPSGHVVSIVGDNAWTANELLSTLRNAAAAR